MDYGLEGASGEEQTSGGVRLLQSRSVLPGESLSSTARMESAGCSGEGSFCSDVGRAFFTELRDSERLGRWIRSTGRVAVATSADLQVEGRLL